MKNIISLFFLISLIFLPQITSCLYAEDKVVAIVNNEVITQKDLNDFLHFVRMQYSRQLKGKELEEKIGSMRQDLLQRLIEDKIMLQQAKIDKISVDPNRIAAKVNDIKKRYALESEFQGDLAKQGLTQADLENKIREQMLMYSLIEQKVRGKVVIRPDEVTSFYEQDKRKFLKPEERSLTIFIFQEESQAKTVSYQLRVGTKLEDLAARYEFTTDKFSAMQGQQLRSEIEDTVFKLGINEVSDPIKVDQQYYVFKLDSIQGSQQLTLPEAQDKIRAYLFDKKMQEGLAKWLDEIKKQTYIKIIEN